MEELARKEIEALHQKFSIPDSIEEMSNREFKKFLTQLLADLGSTVKFTNALGSFGSDLIITFKNGDKVSVRAKRYDKNVGINDVHEAIASMYFHKADESLIIANGSSTRLADTLVKKYKVKIFNRTELVKYINLRWS